MKKLLSYSLSLIAVPLITVMPVLAQKPASSVSVKIGYFNEALVKASFPEAAGSETLKAQAESQLRKDLDDANKQIQQMQEQKNHLMKSRRLLKMHKFLSTQNSKH